MEQCTMESHGANPCHQRPDGYLVETVVLARASLMARQGRLVEAEEMLLPLAESQEPSAAVLDLLAKVCAQQGRLEAARLFWSRALEINPQNQRFLRALRTCERLQRAGSRRFSWKVTGGVFLSCLLLTVFLLIGFGQLQNSKHVPEERTKSAPVSKAAEQGMRTAVSPPGNELSLLVEQALKSQEILRGLPLTVTQNGTVTRIAGKVPSLYLRYQVENVARSVPGVRFVDLGGVEVLGTYAVQKGDTLWAISKVLYGTPERWGALAEANGLSAPYRLRVGQKLLVPSS